jgi:prophage antirepressor-like protein
MREPIKTETWNKCPICFVQRDGEWWAVAVDFESALGMTNINKILVIPKRRKS